MQDSLSREPQKRGFQSYLPWIGIAFLMGLLGYLIFGKLGVYGFHPYDEARHAVSAYEMIRSGDYIVHTYQGSVDLWNLKPPLSFWCIALCYQLFGYTIFAARFYSAFAGMLTFVIMAVFALKRFGKWPTLFMLLALAGTQNFYTEHMLRYGDADGLYQLFFTLAMLCMLMSEKKFAWMYGSAVLCGLAFLTKSTHAGVIPVICGLYLICTGQWKKLTIKRFLLLFVALMAVVLPWAVARYARDGWTFFQNMIGIDVVARMGSSDGISDAAPFVYYCSWILKNVATWVGILLSVGMMRVLQKEKVAISNEKRHMIIGCFLWFAVPIVWYTAMNTRFHWYIASMYYAIPVLTACILSLVPKDQLTKKRKGALALACLVIFVGVWMNVDVVQNKEFVQSYQIAMTECLDRTLDSGTEIYIQYNEENPEGDALTKWTQADMAVALQAGDVICKNGGAQGFEEAQSYAILLIGRNGNIDVVDTFVDLYMIRHQVGDVWVFEK